MSTVYYVAANGDDNAQGTREEPFLTIKKAQEEVRRLIQNGMNQDVAVWIRGGLYELESPLQFDDRDSGSDSCLIRYASFPGEEAIIAGGKRITGWTPFKGRVWSAKLDAGLDFHTLYADGKRIQQARLPAVGYFETTSLIEQDHEQANKSGIRYRTEDLPAHYDLTSAQVFVWPGEGEWNWFSETKPVASVHTDEQLLLFESPSIWPIGAGSRYYIQGSLDFLQAPGQFHLDSAANTLYYFVQDGVTDPNEQIIIAPRITRLLEINGKSANEPVRNLQFAGLRLTCTDFFREYRMMNDNVEQEAHREGLIYCNHAEHIQIADCRLEQSGTCGIYLDRYAKNITIDRNVISHFGYMGISLNGFAPGAGPFNSADASFTNGYHTITNNRIENGGQLVGHGCGILLYQSGHNQIKHNIIANMPRYGISMKGLRHKAMPSELYSIPVTWENHWDFLHSKNNFIAYNDISEVMTDSQDGGLIEAWGVGRGNVIHSNYLHDSGIHFSFGFGIYLDDAADDFTVTNNVITRLYSTGEGKLWMLIFSKGIGNRIFNNLLAQNPAAISAIGSQEMADEENKDIEIARNIIYNSGYLYYFVNYSDARFASADRNLYWNNGAPCKIAGCLPLTASGDDVLGREEYGWAQWRSLANGKYDEETLHEDPSFLLAEKADYRLQPKSPAYLLGWSDIEFDKIGPQ
ncbi:hypothetical protein FHS16_001447 [Paenibacillus endophyticus]|uniref:Right handed beta helix domain-containing protein n=1 Tax=Paenibacillus endophyticus TaxID=1294268 RepID=A0A7W5G8T0_9BACL|nr:right-handed parallel beta-helix repeat-containing protein [Paenibacillus endophyticus]MBB3151404.1 hypothetical protein [Paenibacillus endophyticus]